MSIKIRISNPNSHLFLKIFIRNEYGVTGGNYLEGLFYRPPFQMIIVFFLPPR